MRLTCPNCGARYEVDDSLIPAEGRDVQCSNCATTWFQPGRRPAVEPMPEPEPEAPRPPQDIPEQADASEAPADETAAPDPETGEETPAVRERRSIDPAVRDILRQEADREARLRRGEPDPVETQSEMPLDQPEDAARARRPGHDADLENAQEAFETPASGRDSQTDGARRDLLPDIEEINSTLRATGDRAATEEDASDIETVDASFRRRQGVRIGFGLTVMVAAMLAWLYVNHERAIGWLPAAEPVIERYVGLIDTARFTLDQTARDLVGTDETAE
ncbi:zinc-ribbon domain-containing protein [Maritalea mobilis]|uniref:zinc-ribbon domain-containing protein n=1 Tax=Maritalea mobilis TaxID=483324 RepID=UPI001C952DE9|nr:zinc-ribbon domain-containing protein [Maritalea mobilis]MBY6201925.1 zinc-ribbon domain-containing protein [Maritalea mobilis]